MIAVNESNGVRQLRQRVQLVLIAPAQAEIAAEVAGDDQRILVGQPVLLMDLFKAGYLEKLYEYLIQYYLLDHGRISWLK